MGTASQTVNHGNDGTEVVATANQGYRFIGWSDGVKTNSRTDTNVTSDMSIVAQFTSNIASINYIAGEHSSIIGNTNQTVQFGGSGSEVMLKFIGDIALINGAML